MYSIILLGQTGTSANEDRIIHNPIDICEIAHSADHQKDYRAGVERRLAGESNCYQSMRFPIFPSAEESQISVGTVISEHSY